MTPNNNRPSLGNRPRPRQHVNLHDINDPPAPSSPPNEDSFCESIEHDNDAILTHVTHHRPLLPGYLH